MSHYYEHDTGSVVIDDLDIGIDAVTNNNIFYERLNNDLRH